MRLRATTKIRNDVLIAAREREGLNQTELSKRCGIGVNQICAIERLDFSTQHVRNAAVKVAIYLCCPVTDIMPDEMAGVAVPTSFEQVREVEVQALLAGTMGQRMLPANPATVAEDNDLLDRVREVIAWLPDRRRQCVELRMQGKTYEQIGKAFGVTRECVRQKIRQGMTDVGRELHRRFPGTFPDSYLGDVLGGDFAGQSCDEEDNDASTAESSKP